MSTSPESHSSIAHTMEDYALKPVAPEDRKSAYDVVVTLAGFVISPTAFLLGSVLGAGVTFANAMVAIILGNLVLAVLGYYSGLIGQKTGLTTYLNSRIVFGRVGATIPSGVIGITVMAIVGTLIGTVGTALNALIPSVPVPLAQVIFAVAITLSSIFGFKGLAYLSRIAVPSLIILGFSALFVLSKTGGGLGVILTRIPEKPISLGAAISSVIACWITGVSMVSDIGRYAKKPVHVAASTLVSWVVGAAVFEGISTASAIITGSGNFVQVMARLGLLVPAFIVLFLAMWTTADNNVWSFALAFSNIGDIIGLKLPRAFWDVLATSIALSFGLAGLAGRFGQLLSAISVFSPPIAGVLISHFFLLRNIDRVDGVDVSSMIVSFRWQAFAAWAIGIIVAKAFTAGVPAFQGLLASLISYWLIMKLSRGS
ncbi:MAG: cytosine permease [Candidatus Fermentithermobacillus carboniphilus]|uniref:Cytosine permease n=1 Tax=Candidatus Fermentithermobacillus carboniphilus TaxID=3085328 RepID=A0AAT9LE29_9FIRM|nr:MAG: cytosine permease [Candidatus Fermentithermobacillus carboniphilus]